MRRLTKLPKPPVLASNESAWTEEFLEHVRRSGGITNAPARYRHDEVKTALRTELHDKCAYCEGKISHVSFPHIEHIIPKSKVPELVVRWDNLTLACQICNQKKGDYYDQVAPLVHPYNGDPEIEIGFVGPMARSNGHGAGYRTIVKCDLNRGELVLERLRILEQVERLVRQARMIDDPSTRQFVLEEARSLVSETAEYVSAARCHLALIGESPPPGDA